MKHISKMMILVMVLAITAAFAFRPAGSVRSGKTTYYWYKFNTGDTHDKLNYTRVASQPSCPGTASVCSVQAPDDGTMHPSGLPASGPIAPNGVIQQVGYKN